MVIGLNLCPFAHQPFTNEQISYHVCHDNNDESRLLALLDALTQLDTDQSIETSLVIFTDPNLNFDRYLDLLAVANALMDQYHYTGKYQLASFHPAYQFEGSAVNDASNYTNRSPCPMFHCIREASLAEALASFPDPESIPEKNIKHLTDLGSKHMQQQLDSILAIIDDNPDEDTGNA